MTDVRKMADCWWIWACPECNGFVSELTQAHNETCPNRGRVFAPRDIEVVPLERAEKAEAAARDFAGLLRELAVQDELRTGSSALARVAKALARHREFAKNAEGRPA